MKYIKTLILFTFILISSSCEWAERKNSIIKLEDEIRVRELKINHLENLIEHKKSLEIRLMIIEADSLIKNWDEEIKKMKKI